MKKLYLVDAPNMFFRAYYAIRPLSNSKGMPTNALYGYLSMTVKLLKEIKPDYLAYCFDTSEPTFRNELYEDYKANRDEMPDDLSKQVPYFHKITECLGIRIFEQDGVEADDLIGSLATFGRKHDLEVTIVSGDKDFAQLVNPFVKLYDTMKDVVYDIDGVHDKWGIPPEKMVDYLALVGDASDNVPGVEGVGPKTAVKLLLDHGDLQGIYKNIDSIKSDKLREKIKQSEKNAYLSKELVKIVTDLDLKISLDDIKLKPVPRKQTEELLEELEFKTFGKRIFGDSPSTAVTPVPTEPAEKSVQVLGPTTPLLLELEVTASDLANEIRKGQNLWGIYTERGVFLSDEKKVFVVKDDMEKLGHVLSDYQIGWKGHDLKEFWAHVSLKNPKPVWDHHLAAYVVKAGEIGNFESVYNNILHLKLPDFPSPAQVIQAHMHLEGHLRSKLKERNGTKVYEEIELPLIPVLHSMEQAGICIDPAVLDKQSKGLSKDMANLEKQIYQFSGEPFNISSPKQLSHVLFEQLKLEPLRKTKTGFSTDSDVLEKLSKTHPICQLIIDYRELSKLKSTYVDVLPMLVNKGTQRIHTTFSQALTMTGRLSSANPNLQNIPVRTERGFAIREAFVAAKGKQFISSDYSQIELRILAHITRDPGLVAAFERDLDIHQATASEVFGVDLDQVTPDMRRMAKAVNFGLAYGMSAHGLAENVGISREEAADVIKRYFTKFSKVQDYMQDTIEFAKKHGYVENEMGRRRYIDELKSSNHAIRKFGERAAINAPMQGTASDIVKKAMIDLYQKSDIPMLLQVHDELVFEVSTDELKSSCEKVKNLMEDVVKLNVPLRVNIASGTTWAEAHS